MSGARAGQEADLQTFALTKPSYVKAINKVYPVVQCVHCSFFFRNPTYTAKGLDRAYNSGTYAGFLTGHYSEDRADNYQLIYDSMDLDRRCAEFPRKRLLDVGCGMSLFMNFMRSKGWDVHGNDFAEDCVDLGKQNWSGEHTQRRS